MRRDDLPKEYNGWQVLDPTPQELSDGIFQLNYCHLHQVKERVNLALVDGTKLFRLVYVLCMYQMVFFNSYIRTHLAPQVNIGAARAP